MKKQPMRLCDIYPNQPTEDDPGCLGAALREAGVEEQPRKCDLFGAVMVGYRNAEWRELSEDECWKEGLRFASLWLDLNIPRPGKWRSEDPAFMANLSRGLLAYDEKAVTGNEPVN